MLVELRSPLEEVVFQGLTRAILCLDHEIEGHVRLVGFDELSYCVN